MPNKSAITPAGIKRQLGLLHRTRCDSNAGDQFREGARQALRWVIREGWKPTKMLKVIYSGYVR